MGQLLEREKSQRRFRHSLPAREGIEKEQYAAMVHPVRMNLRHTSAQPSHASTELLRQTLLQLLHSGNKHLALTKSLAMKGVGDEGQRAALKNKGLGASGFLQPGFLSTSLTAQKVCTRTSSPLILGWGIRPLRWAHDTFHTPSA